MKRLPLVCLMLAVLCAGAGYAAPVVAPIVAPGARVAVVGDSITEQKTYSRFIEDYLLACQPQLQTASMQFGWGGEWARGFLARMNNDLAGFKPTVVTLCYGMNDGSYQAYTPGIGKNYQGPMEEIVKRLKDEGVTVVVGGPGAVDSTTFRHDPAQAKIYNDNLGQLSAIAQKIAADNGMPFADVHDALMDAMGKAKAALGDKYPVCGPNDGVHPGPDGHLVMAYAYLKAMGFDGDLGTITVDMKGPATATEGHKVLGGTNGTAQIESSRWPFCFSGKPDDPDGTVSILPFVPFNQDLNRLTLVVKNLDAAQAKVTWGDQSKTFPKADLETGINLAAEFLNNPFSAAFQKLDAAVAQKENFETFMIKGEISQYPGLLGTLDNNPQVAAALNIISAALWARQAKEAAAVRALVTPVQYTITVTPG